MDPKMSPGTKYATFVDLPYELREIIYELALPVGWNIVVGLKHAPLREPSLFFTNRQVRSESMPIFYGRNTFEIPNNREQTWAEQMAIAPGHALPHLRCVRLSEKCERNTYAFPSTKQDVAELEDEYTKKGLREGVVRICIDVGPLWMTSRDLDEHELRQGEWGRDVVVPKAWDGPKQEPEKLDPDEMERM